MFHRQFELPFPPTGLTPTLVFSTSSGISQEKICHNRASEIHMYTHKHSGERYVRIDLVVCLRECDAF